MANELVGLADYCYWLMVFRFLAANNTVVYPKTSTANWYLCRVLFYYILVNIKHICMKHLLSCSFCIIVCMQVMAQTDSTAQKDTLQAMLLQSNVIKKIPDFSCRLLISSRLPDSGNRFYILPKYEGLCDPANLNNKWQPAWQFAGYLLLSNVAGNNHHIYNYTPPKR